MQPQPAIFEEHEIRRVYDEATETWLFSVIDIIQVLTQQPDYQGARKYWKVLKGRLDKEGSQLVTNCYQLKITAEEGRQHHATVESIRPQDAANNKYWSARKLAKVLEYSEFLHFQPVIEQARKTCQISGCAVADHFEGILKTVNIGSGAKREFKALRNRRKPT